MRFQLQAPLLSLGLLVAPALAQTTTQAGVLPYLPAATTLAITVPDLDTSIGEFSQMPLARIWREEEVQNFVRDAMDMLQEQFDQGLAMAKAKHEQGEFPIDPEAVLGLRIKGGTFAVTRMALEMGEHGPMPEFGLMLHVDFGDTAQQWNGLVRLGLDMLQQQAGDEVAREDVEIAGAKVFKLRPTGAPEGMKMGLNVAMVGNGMLIGTLDDELAATLEAMASGTPVLGASDRYKTNARNLATAGAEAQMYMRIDTLIDFGLQGLGLAAQMNRELAWLDVEGLGRAVDALGLRAIESMGATSSYKDGKAVSQSYVVAPAPSRKGLLAGANKNLDLGFLRWVPKDAVSFTALTMEPMSIYDALTAALRAYDEELADKVMGQLTKIEEKIGFSLRDDLFGAMGDTMVTWSMPMASMMSPPEMALLLKVNDQDKIVKVLKSMTEMSQGFVELEEAERRGVKTYQFRVNFDPTQGMGMNPFDIINPSFSFKDGYMVAGFSRGDIGRVFKRMDRGEDADPKTDIRGNKEFAAYDGQIPEHIQSLGFTDWKANFESMYQIVTSMLAFVPMNEDVPLDMSMLPDASTMTKHMFGSVAWSQADGTGMGSTTISPFGPEVALLAVVGIAAGVGAVLAFEGRF